MGRSVRIWSEHERELLTRCIRKPIGAALRSWRKKRGCSLRDVSNDFQGGFCPSWLCHVENGDALSPRVEDIFRLARYHGIPMAEVAALIWKVLRNAEEQSYELPASPVLDVTTLAKLIERGGVGL